MGNSCTHAADAVAHLVTEEEIKEAVRSIEEWQKTQSQAVKNGGPGQSSGGPLLQRVGGPDVVKKVVELFYRKLYGDPRLIVFLHDQDVMHLRAKQSAFISWLFGPPNMPYNGRSVRIAHLRIIKQRGFGPDDYDMGMRYFEEAMSELGAPESIMGEVMRRLRPFKDAFFTPSAKDAEEEARWAAEERAKEEEERQHKMAEQIQHQHEEEQIAHTRMLQQQITLAQRASHGGDMLLPSFRSTSAVDRAADGGADGGGGGGGGGTRSSSSSGRDLGPQCPFTGGRVSRPTSSASGAPPPQLTVPGAGTASRSYSGAAVPLPSPRLISRPASHASNGLIPGASSVSGAPVAASDARPVLVSLASLSHLGSVNQPATPPLDRPAPLPGLVAPEDDVTLPLSPTGVVAANGSRPPSSMAAAVARSGSGASPRASGSVGPAAAADSAALGSAAASSKRLSSPIGAPLPMVGSRPSATLSAAQSNRISKPSSPSGAAMAAVAVAADPLAEFETQIQDIERSYNGAAAYERLSSNPEAVVLET